jgi:hypothetical protein
MKIRALEKLKRYILEEPRRYRQAAWFYSKESDIFREQNPPCGTVGCLAGNACVMEGLKFLRNSVTRTVWIVGLKGKHLNVSDAAQKILGLTHREAEALFAAFPKDGWSPKAAEAYNAASTPEGRAAAAAMELDRYIRKAKREK